MVVVWWLILVVLLGGCASDAHVMWEEYTRAGIQAGLAGQYPRAEQFLTRAAEKAETLGPVERGRSLNNLAELYRRQGRTADAERYFTEALSVKEAELGADHPDVATSLNNLAQLYVTQGRMNEAAILLERSLTIQAKALDPDHPVLLTTLNLLGDVYRRLGRDGDAFEVEVRKRLLREENPAPRK